MRIDHSSLLDNWPLLVRSVAVQGTYLPDRVSMLIWQAERVIVELQSAA
jgi:hypothetical protein